MNKSMNAESMRVGDALSIDGPDIVTNLVASVIFVVCGVVLSRGFDYVRFRRPGRRVWRLRRKPAELHLAIADLDGTKPGEPATGLGELQAVSYLRESLVWTYGRSRVDATINFSSTFPEAALRSTVVSVGGGRFNRITRIVSRRIEFPFQVVVNDDDCYIVDDEAHEYRAELDGADHQQDFGLIARVPNPYNPRCPAFVVRGIFTYGVAGAGRMFSPEFLPLLSKAVRRLGKHWQVLVEVECVGQEVFPRIVRATRISPAALASAVAPIAAT